MSQPKDALNERVVFVSRKKLEDIGALPHGFYADGGEVYDLFNSEGGFAARRELEDDPSRKQGIPYVVVISNRGILGLFRKSTQTEARLHGKISIGVGGHIPDDLESENDVIYAGMLRELHEELHVNGDAIDVKYRGILNDDTNPVGAVHLGLVFTCHVDAEFVSIQETEKMEGHWTSFEELKQNEERMETWSALLLPHLESWM